MYYCHNTNQYPSSVLAYYMSRFALGDYVISLENSLYLLTRWFSCSKDSSAPPPADSSQQPPDIKQDVVAGPRAAASYPYPEPDSYSNSES